MFGEHRYRLQATWTGNRGQGTTGYREYDRSATIEITGKPILLASADKPFRGDPAKWNPEDLLLASLSQCHLLSYLHACVEAGVVVTAYRDEASGLMVEDGRNGARFTQVVLRPHVTVAEASMVDAATRAHEQAHAWCFIANSVNFPVLHQPKIEVAGHA
jgi:organic hydroperoxide reductase OsmC/OhrA